MNKKARSKVPLNPKVPFKWVFMDVIPSTAPNSLTNDTNFKNYLLIFDAVDGITSLKTHLKGAFGFNGSLDIAFLFIEEILHEVQKGPGFIFSSTYYQIIDS